MTNSKFTSEGIKKIKAEIHNMGMDISVVDYCHARIKFCRSVIQKLQDEIQHFEFIKSEAIENELKQIVSTSSHNSIINYANEAIISGNHRTKAFWKEYSMDYLKKVDKFISSNEIFNSLDIPDSDTRNCMSLLSNSLNILHENGLIQKLKFQGKKGYYYGLLNLSPVKH